MANILVTGGAGFIGSHLTTRLVELGHAVRVFDNFSTGHRENLEHIEGRCEIIDADMRDASACADAFQGVEYVFHQAAAPSVPKSVADPRGTHDININGTLNVLLTAVDQKVRRVIYAGSSSAYGETVESPKYEGIRPDPLSPYAVQKATGELYLRAVSKCYGLETITLRYFNVFGSRQDPKSEYAAAIPAFVTSILDGEPPTVYGDGEQTRDFTYIDNIVHGNILAMQAERTEGEVVNVACGTKISINDTIAAINKALGTDVKPHYEPERAGDVRHSCADISLATKLIGYEPIVSFDEGLRRAIDYYRSVAQVTKASQP